MHGLINYAWTSMHTLLPVASFLDRSHPAMSLEICNRKLGGGWGVRLCHFQCEVSLSLFPAPLSSDLSHLLAFQDPYFPGSRTTLLVGSKGLLWMESHPYFLQLHQESHKVQYSVLYFSSSSWIPSIISLFHLVPNSCYMLMILFSTDP